MSYTRVAIIGAGAGGHSVSAQLMRSGFIRPGDISVFDANF